EPWSQAATTGRLLAANPSGFLRDLPYADSNLSERLQAHYRRLGLGIGDFRDAQRALAWIASEYHEPVTMLANTVNMLRAGSGSGWSALQDPATQFFLPQHYRREFMVNTARTLDRLGWLLVDRNFENVVLLRDMQAAYGIVHQVDFGSYIALRLLPRAGSNRKE